LETADLIAAKSLLAGLERQDHPGFRENDHDA
jgi:hypothetical protein